MPNKRDKFNNIPKPLSSKVPTKFAEALAYHQKGKLAEAQEIYVDILKTQPKHFDALHLLGVIAHQTKNNQRAVELIGKAIKVNSGVAAAHYNLGNALGALGKRDEAISSYNQAIHLKSDYFEAYNNLGNILNGLGNFKEAIPYFTQAIQLKRGYFDAHYNMANALNELGRFKEAILSYTEAIQLNPSYSVAHYNLANVLHELGIYDEAITSYIQATKLDPGYIAAHYNLGNALQKIAKYDGAIGSYNQAIQLKPDHVDAHNNLGNALNELGNFEEAIACFTQAIKVEPNYIEAHNNLGNALNNLGRREEAILSYTEAIKLNPSFTAAHYNLGSALKELGKYEEAIVSFTNAIRLKSDFAEAHNNMGLVLHLQGRFLEAKAAYKLGLATNSEPGITHAYLKSLYNKEKGPHVSASVDVPEAQQENEKMYPGLRVWTRPVEEALVDFVCAMPALTPKGEAKSHLHRYSAGVGVGDMTVSATWQVLNINKPIIEKLKADLRETCSSLLNSEVFIHESFVNFYHGKSQIVKHNHVIKMDEDLGTSPQKFSLVYYLRIGDKNAVQPGILKLYNPDLSINPEQGMIILFPASVMHSASYSGIEERIVVGANLYTI